LFRSRLSMTTQWPRLFEAVIASRRPGRRTVALADRRRGQAGDGVDDGSHGDPQPSLGDDRADSCPVVVVVYPFLLQTLRAKPIASALDSQHPRHELGDRRLPLVPVQLEAAAI